MVVYNEYALGYIMPEQPGKVCTLVDRITLGAPFRTMNEPYFIGKRDTVRLAGRKDFDTFRIVFDGYDNPEIYEYDTAWKIQCKLPPKTKRFCPLVLK